MRREVDGFTMTCSWKGVLITRIQLFAVFARFLAIHVASESCTDSRSEFGFHLTGHVMDSFQVDRLSSCFIACNENATCQSMNFNRVSRTCEFNNETRKSRPAKFLRSEEFIHADNIDRALKGSTESVAGRSCRDIKDSGDFTTNGQWIKPVGASRSFRAFCDMAGVGAWIRVTKDWVERTLRIGVTITNTDENGGLVISGQVTNNGCGSGSGSIIFIKGYWTRIKFTQEFRGVVSCWRIFGNSE